ncbi:DMT family transporter [Polaribacter aquimarinus]|uniref:EamA family transporter n=1 Tax=Polaribacter aquimarinus TaxID=2100726 RepID=A0A2U2JCG5_9FLAO|nr:DMT family transporter [Polaribacter aquimarinus]PWG06033.1 EamA family transporter [Polaribacter aquimarinus]
MNSRILALIAVFIAAIIYGLNYTIAKDVMPFYVKPYAFILLRVSGATLFFWCIGFFIKSQKIEKSDYKKIFLASLFGVTINMLAFFKGLSLTTPISASVVMVTTPIMVLIFSAILLKEKILKLKIVGITIGLIGTIILIVYGNTSENNANDRILGNFLVFVNASSYGLYLVLVKGILKKYNPFVFIKWFYLFGFITVLPFSIFEFTEISWSTMPSSIYLKIGFVVLFTTCITYLFNLYGLTKLKPTTVSVFIYLQPVIATVFALFVGSDSLNIVKFLAIIIIFAGVYLVTKQVDKPIK